MKTRGTRPIKQGLGRHRTEVSSHSADIAAREQPQSYFATCFRRRLAILATRANQVMMQPVQAQANHLPQPLAITSESQTLTVLSQEPLARRLPSGLKLMLQSWLHRLLALAQAAAAPTQRAPSSTLPRRVALSTQGVRTSMRSTGSSPTMVRCWM